MQFISTRQGPGVSLETAIMSGTAPDGGLYVPEKLPHFEPDALMQIDTISDLAELRRLYTQEPVAGDLQRSV